MSSWTAPALARADEPGRWQSISGFGRPFGLGLDGAGALYVTDMDVHALCRIGPTLEDAAWLRDPSQGWSTAVRLGSGRLPQAGRQPPGFLDGPHAVDVGPDRRLFVTTYYSPRVRVLSASGQHLHDIGGADSGRRLSGPATAHLDASGRLLVSEYRQNAVLAYDRDGAWRGGLGIGADGSASAFRASGDFVASARPGGFDRPHMCRQRPDGDLLVADTWNHRVQRFSAAGRWLGWLGGSAGDVVAGWRSDVAVAEASERPGAFHAPVALAIAPDGSFVVTDWGNGRLQSFAPDGRFAGIVDTGPLHKPYDAQCLGGWFAVADSHNGRVLVRRESDLLLGLA